MSDAEEQEVESLEAPCDDDQTEPDPPEEKSEDCLEEVEEPPAEEAVISIQEVDPPEIEDETPAEVSETPCEGNIVSVLYKY